MRLYLDVTSCNCGFMTRDALGKWSLNGENSKNQKAGRTTWSRYAPSSVLRIDDGEGHNISHRRATRVACAGHRACANHRLAPSRIDDPRALAFHARMDFGLHPRSEPALCRRF